MNYSNRIYKAVKLFSVNSNLFGKLVSPLESPITFDERCKVTSVPVFIPDFTLLSCKVLDHLSNLDVDFMSVFLQLIVRLNPDFNCCSSLVLS